jgi:hypothetical protein
MTGLSAGQRSMLRYWALNMVWVRFNAIIFTYTRDEQRRLESIAKGVTENAFFGWAFFTALFYVAAVLVGMLIFIAPLLLLYPDTSKTPPALFMGATALMCLFALSVGMPLAMAIGGCITDRLAGTPPSPNAHGDAELYHKILRQIGTMAVVGGTATALWGVFVGAFDIDTARYYGTVMWIYIAAFAAQTALAYGYLRRHK